MMTKSKTASVTYTHEHEATIFAPTQLYMFDDNLRLLLSGVTRDSLFCKRKNKSLLASSQQVWQNR